MEAKIIIPLKIIKAMQLFSETEKDYGNQSLASSLFFEVTQSSTIVYGTDGHILGCYRITNENQGIAKPLLISILNENFDKIRTEKYFDDIEIVIYDIELETKEKPFVIKYANTITNGTTEDKVIPKFRVVFPTEFSGVASQYYIPYFTKLVKVWKLLQGKQIPIIKILHNGDNASFIDMSDENFAGLIMPRKDDKTTTIPEWVKQN